jgi:hypothetical protein
MIAISSSLVTTLTADSTVVCEIAVMDEIVEYFENLTAISMRLQTNPGKT